MSDIAEFLAAQRAGSAEARIEWYEAGASGSVRFVFSLESGAWTLDRRPRGAAEGATGVLTPEQVEALRSLAAQIRPEDDPGGPDLSASGVQELLVVLGGSRVDVRGGEAEWFPARPEALVRALIAMIPGFPRGGRPNTCA